MPDLQLHTRPTLGRSLSYPTYAVILAFSIAMAFFKPYVGTVLATIVVTIIIVKVLDVQGGSKPVWVASVLLPAAGWYVMPIPIVIVILAWFGHGVDAGPEADRFVAVNGTIVHLSVAAHFASAVMSNRTAKWLCGLPALMGYCWWLSAATTIGSAVAAPREFWIPTILLSGCFAGLVCVHSGPDLPAKRSSGN